MSGVQTETLKSCCEGILSTVRPACWLSFLMGLMAPEGRTEVNHIHVSQLGGGESLNLFDTISKVQFHIQIGLPLFMGVIGRVGAGMANGLTDCYSHLCCR